MIASVPKLLDKLARHRPRFVCFVGMIIWEIVRNSLVKLLQQGAMQRVEKGKGREKSRMSLQTYKLVYGNMKGRFRRRWMDKLSDKIALFAELQTLVRMPSSEIDTSGMESIVLHHSTSP
ncbi:hypothetical protein J3R82DRAFT_6402 [Butyriboletus roseoflavus]|nr:hypothetical protein J3R82DRAFT_6402 [Butyriboletus roseoflavus]